MALTSIRDRQNTDPKAALKAYTAIVDAMNAAEAAGFTMDRSSNCGERDPLRHEFHYGPYSIEWDGTLCRWTLTAETDWALDLCAFNQTRDECTEINLCESCWNAQEQLAEADKAANQYRN